MDVNEMKVGDLLKLMDAIKPKQPERRSLGLQLVVLDRGFVYVGHVTVYDGQVEIQDALNVRSWGTTKGLGELVTGPTNTTKLDKVGCVRAFEKAVIHFIQCEEKGWKKEF